MKKHARQKKKTRTKAKKINRFGYEKPQPPKKKAMKMAAQRKAAAARKATDK